MTNEQLTAYLQDDSYLYAVSYEELKTLVMQYPYATNLRILLLKKSFLDQNKDFDRNLQMAATFTTNRKYLYQVVQKVKAFQAAPQSVILGEEYLELTQLSNIEKLLAEKQVSDALGVHTQFDTLAADWQLEFGIDANEEMPKIKGRDAEEDEMFELAFNAQIADNQSFESDEDLNFLIDNIVSEFRNSREGGTDPSVKTDFEADKSDFEFVSNKLELPDETDEETLDLAHLFKEIPIHTPDKVIDFSTLFENERANKTNKIAVDKSELIEKDNTENDLTDDLLAHSFQSIKKEKPDELMANSFAFLNGTHVEETDDNIVYSFIDENELMENKSVVNKEIDTESVINNDIEDELINHEPVINNDIKDELINHEPVIDNDIKDELINTESVINNDIKDELINHEPVIDNHIEDELINHEPVIDNHIEDELINHEPVIDNHIKDGLIGNQSVIDNTIERELINTESDKLSSFKVITRETPKEIAAHSFPIIGKEIKMGTLIPNNEINLTENAPLFDSKETPQCRGDLENEVPIFDEKTDDTTDIMATKKSDLELEILNENKVTIAASPTVNVPSEKLSFTEWLRQFRMNEAAAKGQIATPPTDAPIDVPTLKNQIEEQEAIDNQSFIAQEDSRKTIKQNLDAIFETEEDISDNLFGLLDIKEKAVIKSEKNGEKADNTAGYEQLIFQHLTAEINETDGVLTEKKKKKKKKEMHELAVRSIEEDNDLVSETLADILVWQGKTTKAIDMYLKLSLAFPDKSSYFATKIETIRRNAA